MKYYLNPVRLPPYLQLIIIIPVHAHASSIAQIGMQYRLLVT
jgi:hypothetical protein